VIVLGICSNIRLHGPQTKWFLDFARMNNWFFGILSLFLSAALSGLLGSVDKPQDKTITKFLFVATGLTAASWIGYATGRYVERSKRKEGDVEPPPPHQDLPRFSIQYPSKIASSPHDVVGGSCVNFAQEHENRVWLCVSDGELSG
jgi:hypothetical protein